MAAEAMIVDRCFILIILLINSQEKIMCLLTQIMFMVSQMFCLMVLLPVIHVQHCFQRENILVIKRRQGYDCKRPVMGIWRRDGESLYHY